MIRLEFRPIPPPAIPPSRLADVRRIVEAWSEYDYDLSEVDALCAWDAFSTTRAAGWLILPTRVDDDGASPAEQIRDATRPFLRSVDDD